MTTFCCHSILGVMQRSQSKSELCFDWLSVGQSVLMLSTHLGTKTGFLLLSDSCGFVDVGSLSYERTGLSFIIVPGTRQRSHSWVRVSQDSWPYFTVSYSRLPQPGGPGPHIYILLEQGGPVILPGTGLPFHHLLRLAGLWWRYLNVSPCGDHSTLTIWLSAFIALTRIDVPWLLCTLP
jgi:hypothetical protein